MSNRACTWYARVILQGVSAGEWSDSGGSHESLPGLAVFPHHGSMYLSLTVYSSCTNIPSIISLTLTSRLTIAATSKPLWIQVCSVIRGGKCWLVKKLTWDNQKSNELWITHLNMGRRWRICRAWRVQRGSLGPVCVELLSEGSTARSALQTEAHGEDGGLDKLGTSCDVPSSGF